MKDALMHVHAAHEQRHWWFVARRRIVRELVRELVAPARDRLVVDVGCGTGANAAAFAADYGCIGMDASREAITIASASFPHCRFLVGESAADLGQAAARADVFLLMDVLEHIRDDVAFFTALMAAARPGAIAVITVPADPELWSAHDVTHMHYRRYTRERLAALWGDAPITTLLLASFNTRLYPVVRGVRRLSRLRARSIGQAGTDLSMPPGPVNGLLCRVFAGEGAGLRERLRRGSARSDRRGVSLLAIVRREAGPMERRHRTALEAAADLHDPERYS